MPQTQQKIYKPAKGFTLLELLIVIAILAILATVIVLILNPAETLKKARDTQRISDLSTLKTALGLYLTDKSSPDLSGDTGAPTQICLGNGVTTANISYSKPLASDATCAINVAEGADASGSFDSTDMCRYETAANGPLVTGEGWVPVKLTDISGGSPIANMPVDPSNTVASNTVPVYTDLVYRYACSETGSSGKPSYVFEIDATLESDYYKVGGTDDKSAKDGGDNNTYYEVGNSLRLIGDNGNF